MWSPHWRNANHLFHNFSCEGRVLGIKRSQPIKQRDVGPSPGGWPESINSLLGIQMEPYYRNSQEKSIHSLSE